MQRQQVSHGPRGRRRAPAPLFGAYAPIAGAARQTDRSDPREPTASRWRGYCSRIRQPLPRRERRCSTVISTRPMTRVGRSVTAFNADLRCDRVSRCSRRLCRRCRGDRSRTRTGGGGRRRAVRVRRRRGRTYFDPRWRRRERRCRHAPTGPANSGRLGGFARLCNRRL